MATTAKGIPYPLSTDDNDAADWLQQLAERIEDLFSSLTTTEINALSGGDLWAGRRIYNSTTNEYWYYSGTAWEVDGFARGEIREWPVGAGSPPAGFLWAEGGNVSRTTYANLFSVYGTSFGSGDGSTTFGLPDKRGRTSVALGTDTEFNSIGKTGGAKTKTLAISEMPSHDHVANHDHTGSVTGNGTHGHTATASTTGGNHTHQAYQWPGRIEQFLYKVDSYTGASRRMLYSTSPGTPPAGSSEMAVMDNVSVTDDQTPTGYATTVTIPTGGSHSHGVTINTKTFNTGSRGGGSAFSLLNPYFTTRYIIKY